MRSRLHLAVATLVLAPFLCDAAYRWRNVPQLKIPQGVVYNLPPYEFVNGTSGPAPNTSHPHLDLSGNAHDAARKRCALARGTWCGDWTRQEPLPYKAVPRGSKECPNACSGWGNCNYDTGMCECPAGRDGDDCGKEFKRPCTDHYRGQGDVSRTEPASHIGPDGLDLDVTNLRWTASRCHGFCDDNVAACYCGEGRYRRIPAPPGSPPWTPPVQRGRPLADGCQPATSKTGVKSWGQVKYDDIYGPSGWCNNITSAFECGCFQEIAYPCDGSVPMETTCMNQCSGHGECHFGYCRCHQDWYGADCSRKKAGTPVEPPMQEQRPWLQPVTVQPPAANVLPLPGGRRRPLIYVYDVPPKYTSRMLQYRLLSHACLWRRWLEGNNTELTGWTYSVETMFHELLLQSEHRTFDPKEADFFYVPLYVTCYFWPIMGWADAPWWHAPNVDSRPMHGANMMAELHDWLRTHLPYWDRRGGRDHIWLTAADEGACWMPTAIYNTSIVLTHWGRLEANHTSGTAYLQDVYDRAVFGFKRWPGVNYTRAIKGHPCFDPKKDLVIPAFKPPYHFARSPLLGAPPLQRDILLYFRGDSGAFRLPQYSRGIRQRITDLSMRHDWFNRYKIVISHGGMVGGDYSEHLARSKFCLVAPGDGWSPRAEDAVLHGCIPVVIMDGVQAVFESILDWDSFSIRIREDDAALEALPQLLAAVPPERIAKMQRNLARVWHRFAYTTGPLLNRSVTEHYAARQTELEAASRPPEERPPELRPIPATPPDHPFQPLRRYPSDDDAFGTIMQWLYHRIPDTRGDGAGAGAGTSAGEAGGASAAAGQ